MKALSVSPEWGMPIALGLKTVECRNWSTEHRGELLICSSSRKVDGCVGGHALCVVNLDDIVPIGFEHLVPALLEDDEIESFSLAWLLSGARLVEPFPVRGRQRIFDVPDELVHVIGEPSAELFERYFMPLVYRAKDSEADDIWRWACSEKGWL